MTIFFDFKHSTTCYKKSEQNCFKIQRNSSKSPIFNAKFTLSTLNFQLSYSLQLLLKVKVHKLYFFFTFTKSLLVLRHFVDLIQVSRNVTREFDKLVNQTISRNRLKRRSSSSCSSDEIRPKGKKQEQQLFH